MPDLAPTQQTDFVLTHRPALSGAQFGSFGAVPAGITLTALAEGHVIQVIAAPGADDISARLRELGDGSPLAVRPAGPGQWLVVGAAPLAPGAVADMERQLAGAAVLVDQSHGRVVLGISGAAVEAVLAKGTGVDPALAAFPVGRSVQTLIGHLATHLTRVSETTFEIIVMRSFAVSLWDELITLSLEFGVTAIAP
jgi:sarcosine oxidase subunit gamma